MHKKYGYSKTGSMVNAHIGGTGGCKNVPMKAAYHGVTAKSKSVHATKMGK